MPELSPFKHVQLVVTIYPTCNAFRTEEDKVKRLLAYAPAVTIIKLSDPEITSVTKIVSIIISNCISLAITHRPWFT